MLKQFIVITLVPFCSLSWATSNLNEAAEDVCKCLKEPYAQAKKAMDLISTAQKSGNMPSLVAAQGEMMGVMSASSRCFDALEVKYPDIAKREELQDQVMKIADKKCPNPASGMFNNQ